MSQLIAKDLWASAQNGEKLTTQQRRHVLEWLAVMGEISNYTNVDLAKVFGVGERMVRVDRKKIRDDTIKALSENKDVNFIIADIMLHVEKQLKDLERNKKSCRVGSPTYNQACKMIVDIRFALVKTMQDLGWLPKNLGTSTTESYVHKAVVNVTDGSVSTETIHDITTSRAMIKQIHDNESKEYSYKALIQAPKESDDGDSSIGAV